jgi:hypothetical protein
LALSAWKWQPSEKSTGADRLGDGEPIALAWISTDNYSPKPTSF